MAHVDLCFRCEGEEVDELDRSVPGRDVIGWDRLGRRTDLHLLFLCGVAEELPRVLECLGDEFFRDRVVLDCSDQDQARGEGRQLMSPFA